MPSMFLSRDYLSLSPTRVFDRNSTGLTLKVEAVNDTPWNNRGFGLKKLKCYLNFVRLKSFTPIEGDIQCHITGY